jgi:hypothetical protein
MGEKSTRSVFWRLLVVEDGIRTKRLASGAVFGGSAFVRNPFTTDHEKPTEGHVFTKSGDFSHSTRAPSSPTLGFWQPAVPASRSPLQTVQLDRRLPVTVIRRFSPCAKLLVLSSCPPFDRHPTSPFPIGLLDLHRPLALQVNPRLHSYGTFRIRSLIRIVHIGSGRYAVSTLQSPSINWI